MTVEFQHGLQGNRLQNDTTINNLSGPDKFIQLNQEMYRSNQRLTATHPYGSAWYSWPLMGRPIFYWIQGAERIYLLGNPVVWWASTFAVLFLIATTLTSGVRSIPPVRILLVGAWLMNLLPFIGISRVMFLYHYLTALIWAVLMLAYVVDDQKRPRRTVLVLGILALISFVFFAPLTYGTALSERAYEWRVWFTSWK
jgi:dolichyl-phosphate-mannose-protein mannosyltransferase